MKKNLLFLIFIITLSNIYGQIPQGYYDSANGLTGIDLKNALNDIIKGHVEFPYTSSSTDVWDILKETDEDPNNSNNVILFYTGWSVNANQEYNGGNGWSREHVWSKIHGDFGTDQGAGTDAHHLRPADISVNSAKNCRWFDNCDEPYYDGGIFTGCNTSSTDWVWEPRDEEKGDVARMIFYMATRYEGENGEPDLEIINFLPSDDYTEAPVYAKLNTLLQWHADDPVNDWERNRNNIIYSDFQENRNPFIDHPEWVFEIWGNPVNLPELELFEISIFPNPASEKIKIITSDYLDNANVQIYSISGKLILTTSFYSNLEINISDLSNGIYFIKINSQSKNYTKKFIKN